MSENVLNINDTDYQNTIKSGVTLIDFWAPWCGPCRMQTPILEELATEIGEKAKIAKMNVDDNPQTAQSLRVQSIPTLIVFKDGNPVQQFVGVQQKETLLEAINKA